MILSNNLLCKRWLPAILLILLVGITVYANSFQIPFVLDDHRSITENDVIRSLDNFFSNSYGYNYLPNRYIGYLTFALNYHFGGLDLPGFHIVNLLIHLITALLVYALLRMTFKTPYFQYQPSFLNSESSVLSPHCFIPLFAALLFVIHPVQTQAVSYVVQRVTTLATLFYLLSLVLYVKARLFIVGRQNYRRLSANETADDWQTEKSEAKSKESGQKINAAEDGGRVKPWLLITGSVLSAMLAMKTKEISFTLPLAIVMYEIFFFRGSWKKRVLYLLPLLATLPIIPITLIDFGSPAGDIMSGTEEQLRVGSSMSRLDYLFTQFRVIVTYLRLLVLPVNQNLDYDYPVYSTYFTTPVVLSFLLLIGIFSLAILFFWYTRWTKIKLVEEENSSHNRQKRTITTQTALRLISFGILWFFLTLSVESSFIPIKDVIMEHRLYLPFFGAAAAFGVAFYLLIEKLTGPSNGTLLILSAAILILMFGFATYKRNYVWGDAIRLWQDVVTKSPNMARPINNLGKALEDAGRRSEALKTFSRAIKVDPSYYKAYYNLADLYLISDQPEKAISLLQKAIRVKPDFWQAYVSMSAALMRSGRFNDVISFVEQNPHMIRDHPEAHFYLGVSYSFLGNREAAIKELAIISPQDPALAATLAGMLGLKSRHAFPNDRK